MGTGGAPEGVLTAAAMRCLNGEIFARLVVSKPEHEERCRAMGITDFKKIYRVEGSRAGRADHLRRDRRHRRHAACAACGSSATASRTSSVIMQNNPHRIRFIDSIHVAGRRPTSRSGSDRQPKSAGDHGTVRCVARNTTCVECRRSGAPQREAIEEAAAVDSSRRRRRVADRHAVRPGRRSVSAGRRGAAVRGQGPRGRARACRSSRPTPSRSRRTSVRCRRSRRDWRIASGRGR